MTTLLLDEDLMKKLGLIAVAKGVSKGEIIREALKEYIEKNKKLIEELLKSTG